MCVQQLALSSLQADSLVCISRQSSRCSFLVAIERLPGCVYSLLQRFTVYSKDTSDAEKATTMQRPCTDERWPTQPWVSSIEQRRISTNGRKLIRSHQLMLKHRYRNKKSCMQSSEQSKSTNSRTFLLELNCYAFLIGKSRLIPVSSVSSSCFLAMAVKCYKIFTIVHKLHQLVYVSVAYTVLLCLVFS